LTSYDIVCCIFETVALGLTVVEITFTDQARGYEKYHHKTQHITLAFHNNYVQNVYHC